MTLDELRARADELETAIINTTQMVYILQGHKREVEFQIETLKALEEEQRLVKERLAKEEVETIE
jgi:hypothetical protein